MRSVDFFKLIPIFWLLFFTAACGGGGGDGPPASPTTPTLVSITVTPVNPSIEVGQGGQLTATGTFSDSSTQDITALVSWISSTPSVAIISDAAGTKGAISAVAPGVATLTATLGTVSGSTGVTTTATGEQANVMAITVNGSLCSPSSYINKPCVSVTVCNPDLSACVTVNDILLDTGSYGLRIFRSALPGLTLPQVASGAGSLTGCVQFADGSSLWGPIQRAAVRLGSEPAVVVPIQVIDSSFGSLPLPCANADPSPVSSGFTGILGVGPLTEDCGLGCVFTAANGVYYRCAGTACNGTTVALADQVQNPVARLPLDNNGVIVQLPAVPIGGVPSLNGTLLLGLGTRANNVPAAAVVLPTDANGDIRTSYRGATGIGFFDTGSNGLFFPNADPGVLPVCGAPNSDWYCPQGTVSQTATNIGATGSPADPENFNVTNFITLISSPNDVFSDIAGPSSFGFDWGIPFFMGRSVYFGMEGTTSPLGTGPLVAY